MKKFQQNNGQVYLLQKHCVSSCAYDGLYKYAIGPRISETLYVRNLILDAELAKKVRPHIYTDSAAGKSMATRFGSGNKTKHIELRFLYMQDLVARGDLQIRKVHTAENCADPLPNTWTLKL